MIDIRLMENTVLTAHSEDSIDLHVEWLVVHLDSTSTAAEISIATLSLVFTSAGVQLLTLKENASQSLRRIL